MNTTISIKKTNKTKIKELYKKYNFKNFNDFVEYAIPILEWSLKTQLYVKQDITDEQ